MMLKIYIEQPITSLQEKEERENHYTKDDWTRYNTRLWYEDRYAVSDIVIVSIELIKEDYSIGDKVLILSTKEIGKVDKQIGNTIYIDFWDTGKTCHRSEIAKLPNNL